MIAVFVKAPLAGSIRSVSGQRIRSGLYGQTGNKGAVSVSFKVEETSISAISVHLESGLQSKKAQERAMQLREILQNATVKTNDLVVVSGDFNFRATFPETLPQTVFYTVLYNVFDVCCMCLCSRFGL